MRVFPVCFFLSDYVLKKKYTLKLKNLNFVFSRCEPSHSMITFIIIVDGYNAYVHFNRRRFCRCGSRERLFTHDAIARLFTHCPADRPTKKVLRVFVFNVNRYIIYLYIYILPYTQCIHATQVIFSYMGYIFSDSDSCLEWHI